MRARTSEAMEVVYGSPDEDLIFIPKELAKRLASIHTAVQSADTWGDLKARLPEAIYDEIINLLEECYEDTDEGPDLPPQATDAFDAEDIPGFADGDWPEWPAQEMLSWVPKDAQQRFGKVSPSVLNGDFLEFDTAKTQAIVKALEQYGYTCTEDSNLVAQASGR